MPNNTATTSLRLSVVEPSVCPPHTTHDRQVLRTSSQRPAGAGRVMTTAANNTATFCSSLSNREKKRKPITSRFT